MNHTRRTLALVASVLAGSGLVLIGQQSAQAEGATPCVTTTIAPAALATATAAPSAAADAASLEGSVDAATADSSAAAAPQACAPSPAATAEATAEDAPDNPLCNLPGHRLCVELPTTIPDLPTETDTSGSSTTQPTDEPSTTTTTSSAPTGTGPVVPDPGNGGGNNGGGNNGGGNSGGGNGNGNGNNGGGNGNGNNGGGSAPTGTLGTGPVAVEGNVGSRDNCGALECANQDYADAVATRTQQNAAVPSAAAAGSSSLARTGSDISTMATYAGGLLIAGALLLGARRRLVPGYARRH